MKKWGSVAILALVASVACSSNDNNDNNNTGHENHGNHEDKDTGNGGDDTTPNTPDATPNTPDTDTTEPDATTEDDTGEPPTSDWTLTAHTCAGNRTDTLFCEDDQTCYVACGTTTTGGQGYYQTTDGGATWSRPSSTPANFFNTARVNAITKHGDLLYITGEMPNSMAVVSVSSTGQVEEVFARGNQIWNGFLPGTYARTDDREVVEGKNGTALIYREGGGDWEDGDTLGTQMQDLEVFNDEFWGVGATISEPPTVFAPAWDADGFGFEAVQLVSGLGNYNGELQGIDIDASGVVVGGVNHQAKLGIVFTLAAGQDPTDRANWTAWDTANLFPSNATWIHDVCRHGDTVYAVGRESAESWGFVLKSEDGGATFDDITPYDADGNSLLSDVSRCQAFEDGVIAAGAGGQFIRNF